MHQLLYAIEQLSRGILFLHKGQDGFCVVPVNQGKHIGIHFEARCFPVERIECHKIEIFFLQLSVGFFKSVTGFKGKTYRKLIRALSCTEFRKNIGISYQIQLQVRTVFFSLPSSTSSGR